MKKIFLIASLVLGSFITFPVSNFALDEASGDIRMYVGQIKNISVNSPTRIVVSNPNIADVGNIGKFEVTLSPKSAGYTTLVIWDNFGENSYMLRVYAENMAEYKRRIDNVLRKLNIPGVFTKASDEEAKVYLEGKLKSAQEKDRMNAALGDLKAKTVDLTTIKEDETIVEIDVQILELNKGATDSLGVTWPGNVTFNINDAASKAVAGAGGPFAQLFTYNRWNRAQSNFEWQLDFLIQERKARVLSRPRLSCQSGKEAKLLVGGEVPILSGSVAPGGTSGTPGATMGGSVEYKEYGIIMNIKPVVDENNRVHINLGMEVSEVEPAVVTDYALAYPFTKRNASTELWLDDGQTMAIGGLIKQRSQEDLRKFPWLADLPMLGMFFRQKVTREGGGYDHSTDTELFITLTPHVIPPSKAKEIKKETPAPVPESADYLNEASLDPAGRYSRVIQQRIMENVIYPQQARDAGFQGTARINIKLSYRGELLDVAVKKSSGYNVLDESALAAAKSTSMYPPFPPTLTQEELWIEVPVSYQLE